MYRLRCFHFRLPIFCEFESVNLQIYIVVSFGFMFCASNSLDTLMKGLIIIRQPYITEIILEVTALCFRLSC